MLWFVNVNSPAPGQIGITQLVNGMYIQDGVRVTRGTGGHWWLDGNVELYEGPQDYSPFDTETHRIGLDDNPAEMALLYSVHMTASFKDYLRFRPGNPNDDNIWVTLAINAWNIEGYATTTSGLQININPPASSPSESDEFPIWEQHWPEGN